MYVRVKTSKSDFSVTKLHGLENMNETAISYVLLSSIVMKVFYDICTTCTLVRGPPQILSKGLMEYSQISLEVLRILLPASDW